MRKCNQCNQAVIDTKNLSDNLLIAEKYGSELAGDFGMIPCGRPVAWGDKCILHAKDRRTGNGRRRYD